MQLQKEIILEMAILSSIGLLPLETESPNLYRQMLVFTISCFCKYCVHLWDPKLRRLYESLDFKN